MKSNENAGIPGEIRREFPAVPEKTGDFFGMSVDFPPPRPCDWEGVLGLAFRGRPAGGMPGASRGRRPGGVPGALSRGRPGGVPGTSRLPSLSPTPLIVVFSVDLSLYIFVESE